MQKLQMVGINSEGAFIALSMSQINKFDFNFGTLTKCARILPLLWIELTSWRDFLILSKHYPNIIDPDQLKIVLHAVSSYKIHSCTKFQQDWTTLILDILQGYPL